MLIVFLVSLNQHTTQSIDKAATSELVPPEDIGEGNIVYAEANNSEDADDISTENHSTQRNDITATTNIGLSSNITEGVNTSDTSGIRDVRILCSNVSDITTKEYSETSYDNVTTICTNVTVTQGEFDKDTTITGRKPSIKEGNKRINRTNHETKTAPNSTHSQSVQEELATERIESCATLFGNVPVSCTVLLLTVVACYMAFASCIIYVHMRYSTVPNPPIQDAGSTSNSTFDKCEVVPLLTNS